MSLFPLPVPFLLSLVETLGCRGSKKGQGKARHRDADPPRGKKTSVAELHPAPFILYFVVRLFVCSVEKQKIGLNEEPCLSVLLLSLVVRPGEKSEW